MLDYCETPDEIMKNPDAKRHLQEIAKGDESAFAFLWTMWNFTHLLDDLVDRDKPVSIEDTAKWNVHLIETLTLNEFYIRNSGFLLPLIISMFNRWIDGDALDKMGAHKTARVVRCGDVDLYLTVAYIVGGWDHLRAVKDARSYDEEN